jgi:hypothetical protein
LKKLEGFLLENPKLSAAFERYRNQAKALDLVANLGFGGLDRAEVKNFPRTCADIFADRIAVGLTMDEILNVLRDRRLDSKTGELPQQATLQLTSQGHEMRGDRFVYRQFRT